MNADCEFQRGNALAFLQRQADRSVDLVLFSPPYALKVKRYRDMPANTYIPDNSLDWVDWMAGVLDQCCRISRGMVFCVVDSPRIDGAYIPAVEGLLWTLATTRRRLVQRTPHIWHKNGAPGGPKYPGHDWEMVIACHGFGIEPFYNPTAIGHAAKFDSGPGRQRKANGERSIAKHGVKKGTLSRPRDVVRFTVGGGHMGRVGPDGKIDMADDQLACSGEAPYPVRLADYFIRGWCPDGGRVCDPFVGTGTTAVAAVGQGKQFIGCDVRESQIEIARQRIDLLNSSGSIQ
jgi:hypothetical protein